MAKNITTICPVDMAGGPQLQRSNPVVGGTDLKNKNLFK
jgi:hypothetical protein